MSQCPRDYRGSLPGLNPKVGRIIKAGERVRVNASGALALVVERYEGYRELRYRVRLDEDGRFLRLNPSELTPLENP
jgi:hypothetical protein